ATGSWTPLPDELRSAAGEDCPYLGDWRGGASPWIIACQAVYDDSTGQVYRLDLPAGMPTFGMSSAWGGGHLMVCGGAARGPAQGSEPTGLSNGLWVWTP